MNRMSDDLDDLTLPQRPRRPESRAEVRSRAAAQDDLADDIAPADSREFTLSTGTVLALFFGLALVCAVFFGFGYSMGRKSAAAQADVAALNSADTASTNAAESAANKPAAGSPAIQAIPGYMSQNEADAANRQAQVAPYKAASPSTSKPAATAINTVTLPVDSAPEKPKKPVVDPDSQIVETPRSSPVTKPVPTPAAAAPVQTMNAGTPIAAGGPVYVQIAAVSHKEDADVLLSALKRRGYSAFTRSTDADKFIHVQVGPFASKKDAETMRQKLLGDGYNAMLK